jgi:subtilase family serine protease
MAKVLLKGSERTEVPGARVLAPADATARLEVSVVVRRRARQALQTRVAQLASGNRAAGTLSREEFAEKHGADPADLAAVRKFAAAHGLTVVQEHAARRTVVLAGTVEQFNDAFSVKLQQFSHPEGTYRGRIGTIQLPKELDGVSGHVDFPASSPYVLGCGGTTLTATPTSITSEVVWNDGANGGASGGGISSFFPTPSWQAGKKVIQNDGTSIALTKRGVPDVAGDADPATGYNVRVDGTDTVVGGTSAVAPLWAGLIARINQTTGTPMGYLNPHLYNKPQALRDITRGSNGEFEASMGWDACTGLGSPNGPVLRSAV